MPAPTLVGVGTPAQSPFGVPGPSITLTTANAPAGVALGDRLLCCVRVRRSNSGIANFTPDNPEWTVVLRQQSSSAGGQWQTLGILTARHTPAAWPVTIAHDGIATGSGGVSDIHAVVVAYRPSYTALSGGGVGVTSRPGPFVGTSTTITDEGTVVVFASVWVVGSTVSTQWYSDIAVSNGFTERADVTGWPWQPDPQIGNLKIADKQIATTEVTGLPSWTVVGSGTARQAGAIVRLEELDPAIATGPGWLINRTAIGA